VDVDRHCGDTKLIRAGSSPRDSVAAPSLHARSGFAHGGSHPLTTDGLRWYLSAVENAFGWNGADYAQLVKTYGAPVDTGCPSLQPPRLHRRAPRSDLRQP